MRFFWFHLTLIAHLSVLSISQGGKYPGVFTNECNATSCPRWFICSSNKICVCHKNRTGTNCAEECNEHCKNGECEATTGKCDNGCKERYIPPYCKTELAAPVILWNDTKLRLNYTMKIDEVHNGNITFEIKQTTLNTADWSPVNITLIWKNDEWTYAKASVPELQPNAFYEVRAILDETKSNVTKFNTTWWKPSAPHDLAVIRLNENITKLRWKFDGRLWEETEFWVEIKSLAEPRSRNDLTITASPPNNISAVTGQREYNTTLNIERAMNCTLTVHVLDKNVGTGNYATAWYFFLDNIDWATVKRDMNNTEALISLNVSSFSNLTKNEDVNVIVDESFACTENPSGHVGSTKNEYPACQLRHNESLWFHVNLPKLQNNQTSELVWLTLLLIFVLSVLTFYVLYRKYKGTSLLASLTSPFRERARDIPLSTQCPKPEELSPGDCASLKIQELKKFEDYVRRAAEDGILQQQFKSLPRGLVRSCISGKLAQNKLKNRHDHLIAYDATRVILRRELDCSSTDYINASYVQGYEKERAYIATQAPLSHTVQDFWTMIWQEDVRIICMLVDLNEGGQNVCEKYWPEVEKEENYGDLVVTTMNQRVSTDFTFRTLTVQKQGVRRSRTVHHLQYTGWPREGGVPMHSHSVVEYIQKMLSLPPGQGPIVVHCGPGTGRTGTIILCHICMRRLSAEGTVDVFSEAKTMYSARANMLSNFAQYVLPHLVPTQCLLSIPSKVLCADLTQVKIEVMKEDLPAHIKRLQETSWMDKAMRQLQPIRPPTEENIGKNRFKKLMPVGDNLVTLSPYPMDDPNSTYISAVSVDGAKIRKQYLASQLPMPSTRTDFWRLIVEKNIELVIILQRPDLNDDTCCDIIPRGTLIALPHLKVESRECESSSEFFTTDQLLLTDTSQEPSKTRIITALTCNDWGLDQITRPPSPEVLVDLWMASEDIHRPEGHTLVLCYDGVTGCGLYLALSYMLDRMTVEQECDVILAVRAVRRSRPEFVTSQWQFEYLYDAALKYVESFGEYSNFVRPGGLSMQSEQWP